MLWSFYRLPSSRPGSACQTASQSRQESCPKSALHVSLAQPCMCLPCPPPQIASFAICPQAAWIAHDNRCPLCHISKKKSAFSPS
eukprot:6465328-Amphidinium_carterae.1